MSLRHRSSPDLLAVLGSYRTFFVCARLGVTGLVPFAGQFRSSRGLIGLLRSQNLRVCSEGGTVRCLSGVNCCELSTCVCPLLGVPGATRLCGRNSSFGGIVVLCHFSGGLELLVFGRVRGVRVTVEQTMVRVATSVANGPF